MDGESGVSAKQTRAHDAAGYQKWTPGKQASEVPVGDWTQGQSSEKGGSYKKTRARERESRESTAKRVCHLVTRTIVVTVV